MYIFVSKAWCTYTYTHTYICMYIGHAYRFIFVCVDAHKHTQCYMCKYISCVDTLTLGFDYIEVLVRKYASECWKVIRDLIKPTQLFHIKWCKIMKIHYVKAKQQHLHFLIISEMDKHRKYIIWSWYIVNHVNHVK